MKAKKWKEADEETDRVILKVVRRELEGWLRYEDAQNFSCQDLGMIDKLWAEYSNGEFGISVQEQIYQNLGGTKEYNLEVWKKFGDKVGWRQKGEWLNYTELTSLEEHYSGHLPVAPFWGGVGVWFFSRESTCRY